MNWILILGIYAGGCWAFMITISWFVPGKRHLTDYLVIVFAPIALPIVTGVELWDHLKRINKP